VPLHGGALVRDGRIAAIRHGALTREGLDLDDIRVRSSVRTASSSSILSGDAFEPTGERPARDVLHREERFAVVPAEVVD
jgi:hypothetical protein